MDTYFKQGFCGIDKQSGFIEMFKITGKERWYYNLGKWDTAIEGTASAVYCIISGNKRELKYMILPSGSKPKLPALYLPNISSKII